MCILRLWCKFTLIAHWVDFCPPWSVYNVDSTCDCSGPQPNLLSFTCFCRSSPASQYRILGFSLVHKIWAVHAQHDCRASEYSILPWCTFFRCTSSSQENHQLSNLSIALRCFHSTASNWLFTQSMHTSNASVCSLELFTESLQLTNFPTSCQDHVFPKTYPWIKSADNLDIEHEYIFQIRNSNAIRCLLWKYKTQTVTLMWLWHLRQPNHHKGLQENIHI